MTPPDIRETELICANTLNSRWDLRPSTGQSRPGSGGNKLGGDLDASPGSAVATAATGSWSAHEDGEGNTYYVNNFTGESAWEIPPPVTESAGLESWGQAGQEGGGAAAWSITAAAGEGEAAVWWDGRGVGGDGWGTGEAEHTAGVVVSNPFDGYDGLEAGKADADAVGEHWGRHDGDVATTGWESVEHQEGDGTEDWTQEWDDGSQAYCWYNRSTGESRW